MALFFAFSKVYRAGLSTHGNGRKKPLNAVSPPQSKTGLLAGLVLLAIELPLVFGMMTLYLAQGRNSAKERLASV